jgi:DNA-binding transcriptional LysR family regulator
MVLWPALERFLPSYPDIKAEVVVDNGLIDIVAERFDAGVRTGDIIAKDMIAVPIGPDIRMVVVGSPSYLRALPAPKIPQDLTNHRCINLRLPTHGGIYAWAFEKGKRDLRVRMDGQLVLNSIPLMLNAALAGFGLAYLAEDQVQPYLQSGRLVQVLGDWCPPYAGHHLYYPSRDSLRLPFRCWSRRSVTAAHTRVRRISGINSKCASVGTSCSNAERTSWQAERCSDRDRDALVSLTIRPKILTCSN